MRRPSLIWLLSGFAPLFWAAPGLAFSAAPAPAGQAFTIGAPVVKEGVEIAADDRGGTGPESAGHGHDQGQRASGGGCSRHQRRAHGFPKDAWIPYLDIHFELTKDGDRTNKKTGILFPMTARNGPQYANGADMAGPGVYHLTYIISPPTSHGFIRHVDKASGVPPWWKPITVSWTFSYPSKSK